MYTQIYKNSKKSVLLLSMGVFMIQPVFIPNNDAVLDAAQDPTSLQGGIDRAGGVDPTLKEVGDKTASGFLTTVINFLLSLVALLALAAIVWGGIMYILSLGNDQRAETAKKIILYAVVGLLLVGISFFIIKFVQNFLTGQGQGQANQQQ